MRDCKEIETCLECSAEKLVFVGEVFYYALKAVVHPTGPLFDATAQGGQGALTPLCVKALKRIFLMCDTDQARPARPARTPGPPRPRAGARCAGAAWRDAAAAAHGDGLPLALLPLTRRARPGDGGARRTRPAVAAAPRTPRTPRRGHRQAVRPAALSGVMHAGAQDGALSDAELNAFQVRCFAAPLQPEELAGVKRVVSDKMKEARARGWGWPHPNPVRLAARRRPGRGMRRPRLAAWRCPSRSLRRGVRAPGEARARRLPARGCQQCWPAALGGVGSRSCALARRRAGRRARGAARRAARR